jgi:hypothetical protein
MVVGLRLKFMREGMSLTLLRTTIVARKKKRLDL